MSWIFAHLCVVNEPMHINTYKTVDRNVDRTVDRSVDGNSLFAVFVKSFVNAEPAM